MVITLARRENGGIELNEENNALKGNADMNKEQFFYAVQQGDITIVREMLLTSEGKKWVHETEIPYPNMTPLHWAARNGHVEVLKLLLDHGADIRREVQFGETSLDLAAKSGQSAVAKLLLERGAEVNKVALNGETPLHKAAFSGHTEITSCC